MRSEREGLVAAVLAGDLAQLAARLEFGGPFPQDELDAALAEAYDHARLDLVRALVHAGADINAPANPAGNWPPIFLAVEHLDLAALRALLDLGADVNIRDPAGWTPLHLAVDSEADTAIQTGAPAMTDAATALLLEHGADPFARTPQGRTPLDIAIDYSHARAIARLRAAMRRVTDDG